MSVLWERLAGDTSRFAVKIAFHDDPDDGRAADAETAASWGALQVWVSGVNIAAHVDQGETIQSAHWYLISVLEWMAENWDAVLHEERLPMSGTQFERAADVDPMPRTWSAAAERFGGSTGWENRFSWTERHNLRSARDGGLLPGLSLRRYRDEIEVSWQNDPIAGAESVSYVAPFGVAYQDTELVAHALHDVLRDASEWLLRRVPGSDRLTLLRDRVSLLSAPEKLGVRTALLAGLGSSVDAAVAQWTRLRDRVVETWGDSIASAAAFAVPTQSSGLVVTGSCEAALLFGSASPELIEDDVLALAELLVRNYVAEPSETIQEFVSSEPPDAEVAAWDYGYELADQLHEDLGDNIEAKVDVYEVLQRLDVRRVRVTLADRLTRAVSFASPHHHAVVALNTNSPHYDSPASRRFTVAHELCHLLFDREQGVRLAVASGPWAPAYVERRANAFAAMFLMPPHTLRWAIQESADGMTTPRGLHRVATLLGVAPPAVLEHSYNIGLIDELRREELRIAIGRR